MYNQGKFLCEECSMIRYFVHIVGMVVVAFVLLACGGGGGATSSLKIDEIDDISVVEYFAPFTVETTVTNSSGDEQFYYVDSNMSDVISVSVDDSGVIRISPATNHGGVAEVRVTLIVFTLNDATNLSFVVSIKAAQFAKFSSLSFTPVDGSTWDRLAVRKVLEAFAYGGHATDAQITAWADMPPEHAIVQMLTFDAKNPLLSPSDSILPDTTSLETLSRFWSSDSSDNFISAEDREHFEVTRWNIPATSWALATMTRGLNPFLHRIGLWETNYHMSANQDAGIYPLPMLHHYDNIVKALSQNSSYDSVIAQGAKNAAIAYQYGHNRNSYSDGTFRGNEDFAREYHQLFLGILGEYDPTYHEGTAIPNTARALTDMQAKWHNKEDGGPDTEITFGTDKHYTADLEILKNTISGARADIKLDAIASVGIVQAESLANLPIMIIKHLADDNLAADAMKHIRDSWAAMDRKELLPFLWAYATSEDFHSSSRFKYASTIERIVGVLNSTIVSNDDHKYQYYDPTYPLYKEGIVAFRPTHDVFGHQTGLEASDSADVFRINYNSSTKDVYQYIKTYHCIKDASKSCPKDAEGNKIADWEKNWGAKIPTNSSGEYIVDSVASWLWSHFVGDEGKNYGVLERAHIVALLNDKDIGLLLDEDNPLRVYTLSELTNDTNIKLLINDGAVAKMALGSSVVKDRREANKRVGLAIAFIAATPYMYAQEGR